MNSEVEHAVEKKRVIKEDGRYLIFYGFERPLPEIHADQAREAYGHGGRDGRGEAAGTDATTEGVSPGV